MSLRQLLAVSDALEHEGDELSPFQPTSMRVVPRFGESRGSRSPEGDAVGGVDSDISRVVGSTIPASMDVSPILEEPNHGIGRGSLFANRNRRRAVPRSVKRADTVHIVRNDLAESDYEVVPVLPQPFTSGGSSSPAGGGSRLGRVWDKCSARLMSLSLGWFK